MTETADEEIIQELALKIKCSLTVMLQCASHEGRLAELHAALLKTRVR